MIGRSETAVITLRVKFYIILCNEKTHVVEILPFDLTYTTEQTLLAKIIILGLRPANERRRYFVTTSLIGWAQA